jgi:hypothetical protein
MRSVRPMPNSATCCTVLLKVKTIPKRARDRNAELCVRHRNTQIPTSANRQFTADASAIIDSERRHGQRVEIPKRALSDAAQETSQSSSHSIRRTDLHCFQRGFMKARFDWWHGHVGNAL